MMMSGTRSMGQGMLWVWVCQGGFGVGDGGLRIDTQLPQLEDMN